MAHNGAKRSAPSVQIWWLGNVMSVALGGGDSRLQRRDPSADSGVHMVDVRFRRKAVLLCSP